MEFRDLKKQYQKLKSEIDTAVAKVIENTNFISGKEVAKLEEQLAEYVGVTHCITCANGTDALQLALMAWEIGPGDAVFVPDFTFFASAEVIAAVGAVPVFVDVLESTFNLSPESLTDAIENVLAEGKLKPQAVIAVDLFGLPADYTKIQSIAKKYGLYILEDGAQGFGGRIGNKKACSFGDIAATSFFPSKPLGCYGDGSAVFTNNKEWAEYIRSLCVHGKGENKYDNIRIGMNSRLDTIQAAILKVKLKAFQEYELEAVNTAAARYTKLLQGLNLNCQTPEIPDSFFSSQAQYTIRFSDEKTRSKVQAGLKERGIPSMIYYQKTMHEQKAFETAKIYTKLQHSAALCKTVLSLPMHPYLQEDEQKQVCEVMEKYLT